MTNEPKCKECGAELECEGGSSVHRVNWYCPNDECESTHQVRLGVGKMTNEKLLSCPFCDQDVDLIPADNAALLEETFINVQRIKAHGGSDFHTNLLSFMDKVAIALQSKTPTETMVPAGALKSAIQSPEDNGAWFTNCEGCNNTRKLIANHTIQGK